MTIHQTEKLPEKHPPLVCKSIEGTCSFSKGTSKVLVDPILHFEDLTDPLRFDYTIPLEELP